MPCSYSSLAKFKAHWPDMPEHLGGEATQKLNEAALEVEALYPDLQQRISAGALKNEVVALVINRMVKRALSRANPELPDGITQLSNTVGPFAQSMSFNSSEGNLYLTAADRRLLAPKRVERKAWTIEVS